MLSRTTGILNSLGKIKYGFSKHGVMKSISVMFHTGRLSWRPRTTPIPNSRTNIITTPITLMMWKGQMWPEYIPSRITPTLGV